MGALCIQEQNVCSFSNIISHRNRLQLFVKQLVMRTLIWKYLIRQTINQNVKIFRHIGSVYDWQHVRRRRLLADGNFRRNTGPVAVEIFKKIVRANCWLSFQYSTPYYTLCYKWYVLTKSQFPVQTHTFLIHYRVLI